MEPGYWIIIALTAFVFIGLQLVRKFPNLKAVLPYIPWMARLVSRSFSYWKLKKVYKDEADLVYRYSVLLNLLVFSKDSANSKLWINKFVSDTYFDILKYSGNKDDATRISSAMWVLLNKHPAIIDTIQQLGNPKDLDVKKATMIAIDVLGEIVDMSDKMDVFFYQSVIYGINKALLEVKNAENNKQRVYDVSGTLWRLYQLTLAYKNQRSLTGLTKDQFYSQVKNALETMYQQFSAK